jgi:hypothetical protein
MYTQYSKEMVHFSFYLGLVAPDFLSSPRVLHVAIAAQIRV